MINVHYIHIMPLKSAFIEMSDFSQTVSFVKSQEKNIKISLDNSQYQGIPRNLIICNGKNLSPSEKDTCIGLQRHRILKNRTSSNTVFLGDLKANLAILELYSRDVTHVSIDLNVLKKSELPFCADAMPSGLTTEEFAQIARYLGFSNSIESVTITNQDQMVLQNELTIEIIAEFLWYFTEGVVNRVKEDPYDKKYASMQYLQHSDFNESLLIYKSLKSDRRWVSMENKKVLVPCSNKEYELLQSNEMPERVLELLTS